MAHQHETFSLFWTSNMPSLPVSTNWVPLGQGMATSKATVPHLIGISLRISRSFWRVVNWFPNPGFFLGMVHGSLFSPQTGELRPHVTTLVTLSDPAVIRGYRAGRVWFFYEADPEERRLTDTSLMQRLHELATERHTYRDKHSTIHFALGCLLGELSGHVFPLTQQEHERIQEEDRQFLSASEGQRAEMSQMTVLHEA